MDKDKLTIWTVEEIADDLEYQQKEKQLYEKEEVDDAFSSIYQKVCEALKVIEGIEGLEPIDECKSHLQELEKWVY